jgi:hypothetical protein
MISEIVFLCCQKYLKTVFSRYEEFLFRNYQWWQTFSEVRYYDENENTEVMRFSPSRNTVGEKSAVFYRNVRPFLLVALAMHHCPTAILRESIRPGIPYPTEYSRKALFTAFSPSLLLSLAVALSLSSLSLSRSLSLQFSLFLPLFYLLLSPFLPISRSPFSLPVRISDGYMSEDRGQEFESFHRTHQHPYVPITLSVPASSQAFCIFLHTLFSLCSPSLSSPFLPHFLSSVTLSSLPSLPPLSSPLLTLSLPCFSSSFSPFLRPSHTPSSYVRTYPQLYLHSYVHLCFSGDLQSRSTDYFQQSRGRHTNGYSEKSVNSQVLY